MSGTPLEPAQAIPRIIAALEEGRPCRLTVTGRSMTPFLRHGRDAVLLEKGAAPYRVGDILLYLRAPHVPVLHRVVRVERDGTLVLCGDAQTALEPVHPRQVLGRATHVERNGRSLPCSHPALRARVALWIRLRPLRRCILAARRRLGRLK